MSQKVLDERNLEYRIDCARVSDVAGEEPLPPSGVECREVLDVLHHLEHRVRDEAWEQYRHNAQECASSPLVERIVAWCDSVISQVMENVDVCQ
jgi:hypothetical protein